LAGIALSDVILAAGEALANAVEHGYRRNGEILVAARLSAARLELEVADDGPGFTPGPRPAAPPAGEARGFGTFLMYRLMDEVEFDAAGSRVRLVKAFGANQSGASLP
jgi:anti-sigma regulatory factor (Ser/Thr protein kinase)